MSRMKTTVRQTINLKEGLTLVLAFSGRTTNPQGQYPAWLEKWCGDYLVRLHLSTGFGWSHPSNHDGVWDVDALTAVWDEQLREARCVSIKGPKGIIRQAPEGTKVPEIEAAKEVFAAAQKAAAEAKAAKQRAESEAQAAEVEARDLSEEELFRAKTQVGAILLGFSSKEEVVAIDGDNYTLRNLKTGKVRTENIVWLKSIPIQ